VRVVEVNRQAGLAGKSVTEWPRNCLTASRFLRCECNGDSVASWEELSHFPPLPHAGLLRVMVAAASISGFGKLHLCLKRDTATFW
jgi:hypothetical protein